MLHGQEHNFQVLSSLEQFYWKLVEAFLVFTVLLLLILVFCAMSRCFPFPPPGYEKKSRPDNVELFKEEKHREKKHKKDKKKKESKERREKDKSDKKHREKKDKREKHKDKREKHRDKKKDKDRDKDKEKSSISVEKNVSEGNNGEKLHEKEGLRKDKSSSILDEKRSALQFHGHKGVDPTSNSLQAMGTDDFKFVLELERRNREKQKGTRSQLDERSMGTNWKNDERREGYVGKDMGNVDKGKQQNSNNRVEDRKMGEQRIGDEVRSLGNAMVQNIVGIAQKKVGGLPQLMEKNYGKNKVKGVPQRMEKNTKRQMYGEEKEKSKDRVGDDKREDKRKDKERSIKKHGKDKDGNKEKKKREEKVKKKSEYKKAAQDKLKHTVKNNLIDVPNNESLQLPKDNDTSKVTEGNHKKRKDIETNGFLHDNEVWPIKIPRLPSSFKDNGRKLEACQTPGLYTYNDHGVTSNIKIDNKEPRVNGFREAQPSSAPTTMPLLSVKSANPMAEAPRKLPHPDSKYLNQIFSVPKVEGWSNFDEQEWLFSSRGHPQMKPEAGSVEIGEELCVWDGPLLIESADICALPYVIPY